MTSARELFLKLCIQKTEHMPGAGLNLKETFFKVKATDSDRKDKINLRSVL